MIHPAPRRSPVHRSRAPPRWGRCLRGRRVPESRPDRDSRRGRRPHPDRPHPDQPRRRLSRGPGAARAGRSRPRGCGPRTPARPRRPGRGSRRPVRPARTGPSPGSRAGLRGAGLRGVAFGDRGVGGHERPPCEPGEAGPGLPGGGERRLGLRTQRRHLGLTGGHGVGEGDKRGSDLRERRVGGGQDRRELGQPRPVDLALGAPPRGRGGCAQRGPHRSRGRRERPVPLRRGADRARVAGDREGVAREGPGRSAPATAPVPRASPQAAG